MQLHAREETLLRELDELRYKLPECRTLDEYDMVHLQIAFYKDVLRKYHPEAKYKNNRVVTKDEKLMSTGILPSSNMNYKAY